MKFPKLSSMRVLNEEQMLALKGGEACAKKCKTCKSGCSSNKNNNQGNGSTASGTIKVGYMYDDDSFFSPV